MRITILLISLILCCSNISAEILAETTKQTESIDITPKDTLKKDNFFRRFYRYFDESNEDKTLKKRFDISIIGGPNYSSDTKFSLGMVAGGQFRTDRKDSITQPSNVSLWGSVSTTGFFLVGIRGNTLWKQKKHRLDYLVYFFSMPTYYWGLGYADGVANMPSKLLKRQTQFRVDYLYSFAKNTYVGPSIGVCYIMGSKAAGNANFYGQRINNLSSNVGALFIYDSRDAITEAHTGAFVRVEQQLYPKFMNSMKFASTDVIVDYYHKMWKGAVLAYDLHGTFTYGNTPWTRQPTMGGSNRMRGYYYGQYTDKNLTEFQVEYRQKIYNRHGVVAWGGAANIFNTPKSFKWSQTLFNYGVGYRWEFKKRMNVRIDYGWGKNCNAFIFGINEAF